MIRPSDQPLLIRGRDGADGVVAEVSAAQAGWEHLDLSVRRLSRGQVWRHHTGDREFAHVILAGVFDISAGGAEYRGVGRRADVFSGLPHALYVSRDADVIITAASDEAEIALGSAPADAHHPTQLITPADVEIELRGGGNASRQINRIIPPGFDCERLVSVEVLTPGGNWSSFPPHKHDTHIEDDRGHLLEADLEEVYFYKLDPPGGFACQRVYTVDGRLDELMLARHDDIVLVPEGYHPVVTGHGYTSYYLNVLAGSAQSLANSFDPCHAWVMDSWDGLDPRVPLVTHETEAHAAAGDPATIGSARRA